MVNGRALGPLAVLAAVAAAPRLLSRPSIRELECAALGKVVDRRHSSWRRAAGVVTELAAPPMVASVVAAAAVRARLAGASPAVVRRVVATAGAGVLVRRGLAEMVRRQRPPQSWWWAAPTGFSYPSRHVTWAMLGYGASADLLCLPHARGDVRCLVTAPVLGVAATRVVLAVHWPSDVLGAAAFAWAWRRVAAEPSAAQAA